jgi:hypothetical protein
MHIAQQSTKPVKHLNTAARIRLHTIHSLEMDDAVVIAAVFVSVGTGGRSIGYAVLRGRTPESREDKKSRELALYDTTDTERYANFESLLVQTAPSHVYISDLTAHESELKKLQNVCEASSVTCETVSKSHFSDKDWDKNCLKLAGVNVTILSVRRL